MTEKLQIEPSLIKKIIKQLILSDGMEITNKELIQQKIYYIDNVSLIETLETILFTYYFHQEQQHNTQPNVETIYKSYQPLYINSDKLYTQLIKENNETIIKKEDMGQQSLNQFI